MSIKLPFNDYPILIDALETWGTEEQFFMVVEECGELLTAINQFRRGRIDKSKLATEIADVFILMNQMAIIAGEPDVQEQIEYKMQRLKGRLESIHNPVCKTEVTLGTSSVTMAWSGDTIVVVGVPPVQPEDPQPV